MDRQNSCDSSHVFLCSALEKGYREHVAIRQNRPCRSHDQEILATEKAFGLKLYSVGITETLSTGLSSALLCETQA